MPTNFYDVKTVIMDQGRSLANIGIESGFKIRICTFKVGDGAPDDDTDPLVTLTDLNNVVWPPDPNGQPVTAFQFLPNASGLLSILELFLFIPPQDPLTNDPLEGFEINEVGIYLENGVLLAVAFFPTLPKIGNIGISIRVQLEIENADSVFEFKGDVAELELTTQFTWLYIAGALGQSTSGYLHQQIDINRHRIDDLTDCVDLLKLAFACEHRENGSHKPKVVDREFLIREAVDRARLEPAGLAGPVTDREIYIHPVDGDDNNLGSVATAPKKSLMAALIDLPDDAGLSVKIFLFGDDATPTDAGQFPLVGDALKLIFDVRSTNRQYQHIVPGTFTATDTVETFTDNSDGTLTGSLGGTGTINYLTGQVQVTFNAPPPASQVITFGFDFRYFYDITRQIRMKNLRNLVFNSYADESTPATPADMDFLELVFDFNSQQYQPSVAGISRSGLLVSDGYASISGMTVLSPFQNRGPDRVATPIIGIEAGGRAEAFDVILRPHPLVSDSFSDSPTDDNFYPLIKVKNGASFAMGVINETRSQVHGLSQGQVVSGNTKKGLGITFGRGGAVRMTDVQAVDVHRLADNALVESRKGGIISVTPGNMDYISPNAGPETTPRFGLDDKLTVRNINDDGTAVVADLY